MAHARNSIEARLSKLDKKLNEIKTHVLTYGKDGNFRNYNLYSYIVGEGDSKGEYTSEKQRLKDRHT